MGFIGTFSSEGQPVIKYPNLPIKAKNYWYGDDFDREVLNPTNAVALYTEAVTGTGSGAKTTILPQYRLSTSNATGDDVSLRTNLLNISRTQVASSYMDTLRPASTNVELWLPFDINTATSTEMFIGLYSNAQEALTALPTTTKHLGVYLDQSAGANWMITSGNAGAQVTNDTEVAADTATHIVHIVWTGDNAATINFMTAAGVVSDSSTVTALAGTQQFEIHWFMQTETTAVRSMDVKPWLMRWY